MSKKKRKKKPGQPTVKMNWSQKSKPTYEGIKVAPGQPPASALDLRRAHVKGPTIFYISPGILRDVADAMDKADPKSAYVFSTTGTFIDDEPQGGSLMVVRDVGAHGPFTGLVWRDKTEHPLMGIQIWDELEGPSYYDFAASFREMATTAERSDTAVLPVSPEFLMRCATPEQAVWANTPD